MATSDSDSAGVDAKDRTESLESAGRELVHDVATPLATIQLNLQFLTDHLPKLINQQVTPSTPELGISPDHLKALATLPAALDADIRKIRHAVQLFSAVLVPGNVSQPKPGVANSPFPSALPRRILLVEDEVVHQEITLKQLAGRCRLDVAATGGEALAMLADASYDLVLLDLMLSGRDASGLVGELRSLSREKLRVVLVSNMPLNRDEVAQLKADGALEKPFRLASLETLLLQLDSA